jgi:hypothetical protein
MAIYLGYYRATPQFIEENQARLRREGGNAGPPACRRMVQELPDKLPAGCRIVGSYAPVGGGGAVLGPVGLPSVQIVETSDPTHLDFISQYYNGYLIFQWTPATSVGGNRQERAAWAAATAVPAGARG